MDAGQDAGQDTLPVHAAAVRLGISPAAVRKRIRRHSLPAFQGDQIPFRDPVIAPVAAHRVAAVGRTVVMQEETTSTLNATQFTQLVALLRAGGYEERAPSARAAEIDGGELAEATCETCGHVGLTYRPFTLKSSYRAFAVCSACGAAEEF